MGGAAGEPWRRARRFSGSRKRLSCSHCTSRPNSGFALLLRPATYDLLLIADSEPAENSYCLELPMRNTPLFRTLTLLTAILAISTFSALTFGQGCVAAHTEQPLVVGLDPTNQEQPNHRGDGLEGRLHNLTVTVGFRTYSSYKHYIGTDYQERRALLHNQVQNHVNLYDLTFNYQVTPRFSIIGDIPGLTASRHQQGNVNVYHAGGIGDITAGVQTWVFRPPTESHGNVAFSMSLKMPTGINDAKGTTILANGATQIRNF